MVALILLGEAVFVPEPPVHEDGPELHVEDDGVASEEAQLLLQQRSFLRPGHVVGLESRQLQASSLGLQAHTLIVVLRDQTRCMMDFLLHFKESGETLCWTSGIYLWKHGFPVLRGQPQPPLVIQAILEVRGRCFPVLKPKESAAPLLERRSPHSHHSLNPQ